MMDLLYYSDKLVLVHIDSTEVPYFSWSGYFLRVYGKRWYHFSPQAGQLTRRRGRGAEKNLDAMLEEAMTDEN